VSRLAAAKIKRAPPDPEREMTSQLEVRGFAG
jgi:hypothetical protein